MSCATDKIIKRQSGFLKPLIPHFDMHVPVDWDGVFSSPGKVNVEIGFGLGEVLIREARLNKTQNYVGIEQNWERTFKALKTVTRINADPHLGILPDNLRILYIDAWIAFERLFCEKSVARIYSLFPCPWPKKSHVKNRLFSHAFLKLLNSRLADRGELKVVTDYAPYYDWIAEESRGTGFVKEKHIISSQFDTKFEKKWKKEGRQDFYEIRFIKQKHCPVAVKEGVGMKSFKVHSFDPDTFEFQDHSGDISVIKKDYVYDAKRQKAVICLIVAEEHLTQHFRVAVTKQHGQWVIAKERGQSFFPTPGINKAISLVYESIKAAQV